MNDVERELRSRFTHTERRLVGPDFAPVRAPDEVLGRTRRRQVVVIVTAVATVAALVAGSFAGVSALLRASDRRVPADPDVTFTPGTLEAVASQPISFEGLVADTEGNLWSTIPALTRFDPRSGSFRTFTIADHGAFGGVIGVAPATEGGVWMLSPWYGEEQTVRRIEGERIIEASPPAPGYVGAVVEGPDGTIWASGEGVYAWHGGGSWETVSSEGRPTTGAGSPAVDSAGNVWVENIRYPGPDRLGVSRFDGNAWTSYPVEEVFPFGVSGPDGGAVWTIVPGPAGDVWVGGNGAVSHFADGGWTSYRSDAFGLRNVMSIAVADGAVWVAGEAGGPPAIARFDGTTWVPVVDGLEGDGGTQYTRVVPTPEGLWASTNTGLLRLDGSRWQLAVAEKRPSDVMPPIAAAGADELWMGDWTARGGVWRLQGDQWTHFSQTDGIPGGDRVAIAVTRDGSVWVASGQGLASFDGVAWEQVDSVGYGTLEIGPDGRVWTARDGPEGSTVQPVGGPALPKLVVELETGVTSLAIASDGDVWAGSSGVWGMGGGLAHFDGNAWQKVEPIAGEDHFLVQDIEATADGDVWVTAFLPANDGRTSLVVARLRDGIWTTFDEIDGIRLDRPAWFDGAKLGTTTGGDVLLALNHGLFVFREDEWTRVQLGRFTMLSVAPEGTVWLAGDGLFRIPQLSGEGGT